MQTNHTFSKRHIERFNRAVIVGLGVTGYSVVRYLCAQGINVAVVDSRTEPPMADRLRDEYPKVQVSYGEFTSKRTQALVADAELLVVNPGVSLKTQIVQDAKRRGATLTGDIELFLQANKMPVIAITGSNGKSTVTTLVGQMAQAAGLKPLVAGNIGYAALDALTDKVSYDLAVLELSSFQLESTQVVGAKSAAILNISADHMDRYDSFGDYVLAKAKILKGSEIAVLPSHDSSVSQITTQSKVLSFGLQEPTHKKEFGIEQRQGRRWLTKGKHKLMAVRDIPLIGSHNISNVLAAFALLDPFKLDLGAQVGAVKSFKGLPHRMQTVAQNKGVTWVNDSKATNVGAAVSALTSIDKPIIWIAGGDGKGADFSDLAQAMTAQIKLLVALGRDAPSIIAAVRAKVEVVQASSMQDAVEIADKHASEGDVVLLSPACASFDMYRNYEERGEDFATCVLARTKEAGL